jgi:hypothetical protein
MRIEKEKIYTDEYWINEITLAYLDAKSSIPFGLLSGDVITESKLFSIAPLVCLKFREIEANEYNRKRATDAALSSYVATTDMNEGVLNNPIMAFSFCYVLSHFGLDLLNEQECELIMEMVEANLNEIEKKVELSNANGK